MITPVLALISNFVLTPIIFVMVYIYYNYIRNKPDYWDGKKFSGQFQSFVFFISIMLYFFIYLLPEMLYQIGPGPNLPSFSAAGTIGPLIGYSWLMFALRKFYKNGLDRYYLGLAVAFTVAVVAQLLLAIPWLVGLSPSEWLVVKVSQTIPFIIMLINEITFLEANNWNYLPEDPK